MYNRYVQNDGGVYRPLQTPPQQEQQDRTRQESCRSSAPPGHSFAPSDSAAANHNPLSALLGKLRISDWDTGDLLLLLLLFLLLREGEDDELLIALGLLLFL